MPSYQDVLNIFKDYLDTDPDMDVVITRHACAVMLWDPVCQRYTSTVTCRNGKELFDQLLNSHENYWNYKIQTSPPQISKKDIQNQQLTYLTLYNKLHCAKKTEPMR